MQLYLRVDEFCNKVGRQRLDKLKAFRVKKLADDIHDNGLEEPLVLTTNEAFGLIIVDGIHRLAACQLMDVEYVPVVIRFDVMMTQSFKL